MSKGLSGSFLRLSSFAFVSAAIITICFTNIVQAQDIGFTFQGLLRDPSANLVNASSLSVRAQVLSPNNCVLRDELFTGVNVTNGYLGLAVGKGTPQNSGAGGLDTGLTLQTVFNNQNASITGLTCLNSDGTVNGGLTSYSPAVGDARKLRLVTVIASQNVVATFNMRSVPFAVSAELLAGKTSNDFLQTNAGVGLTQSNLQGIFGGSYTGNLTAATFTGNLVGNITGNVSGNAGNFTGSLSGDVTGTQSATVIANNAVTTVKINNGAVTAAKLNQMSANTNDVLKWNGTAWAPSADAGLTTVAGASLTSGQVWVGNGSNNAAAVAVSGDASLANTGALTVTRLQSRSVSSTAPTSSGQVLRWDQGSTNWAPSFLTFADIRSTVTPANTIFPATSCTAGQTLNWSSLTDTMTCTNIVVSGSSFGSQTQNLVLASPSGASGSPVFRSLATADLPASAVIGGGNSIGAPLTVGTNDNQELRFETNGTDKMTVLANGNVGIGTTSPSANLVVSSSSATAFNISSTSVSSTNTPTLNLGNALSVVSDEWNGVVDIKSIWPIRFLTSGTERMRIDNSGNVGIGQASTPDRLHVYGISRPNVATILGHSLTESVLKVRGDDTDGTSYHLLKIGNATSEKMVVRNDGNVGIGTTSPTERLDVAGTIKATSMVVGGTVVTAWGAPANSVNFFSFTNQTGVTVNTTITSDAVTLAGSVGTPLAAACSGCIAIARNGVWGGTSMGGFIAGDTITLRVRSSPNPNEAVTANVTVGTTVSNTWTVTTSQGTPNAFSFADQTNVTPGFTASSNAVTLTGFTGSLTATCSSPCVAIARNGVWQGTTVTGFVANDTIAIRMNASTTANTAVTGTVSVGGTTSSVWSVTSMAHTCGVALSAAGVVCTDGTVYAGVSTDGLAQPIFVTRCDLGQTWDGTTCTGTRSTPPWNNGTTNWTGTGITSNTNGEGNTTSLVALADIGAPYQAAIACDSLSIHGQTDWYLPGRDELNNNYYLNRMAIGNFDLTGNFYWSSSEQSNVNAWIQRFSDGTSTANGKTNNTFRIRCARR